MMTKYRAAPSVRSTSVSSLFSHHFSKLLVTAKQLKGIPTRRY